MLIIDTNTSTMIHRGNIVEKVVKKSGFSITKLAKRLNISRNTLYNRFSDANLSYSFIMQIGRTIYYDFSIDFPEMKQEANLIIDNPLLALRKEDANMVNLINKKYIQLLEEYSKLLSILVRVANQNQTQGLKKELTEVIENKLE